jgi:hypothetical protein
MADRNTTGYGIPLHADMAKRLDEAVVKGQILEEENMRITFYGAEKDYKIGFAALISGNSTNVPRMLHCVVDVLKEFPSGTAGYDHKNLEDGGIYFNTAKLQLIYHGWNLSDHDAFIYAIKDITRYDGSKGQMSPHSYPKVMGVTADAVIVMIGDNNVDPPLDTTYTRDGQDVRVEGWNANDETMLGDWDGNSEFITGYKEVLADEVGYPRFLLTLIEKV